MHPLEKIRNMNWPPELLVLGLCCLLSSVVLKLDYTLESPMSFKKHWCLAPIPRNFDIIALWKVFLKMRPLNQQYSLIQESFRNTQTPPPPPQTKSNWTRALQVGAQQCFTKLSKSFWWMLQLVNHQSKLGLGHPNFYKLRMILILYPGLRTTALDPFFPPEDFWVFWVSSLTFIWIQWCFPLFLWLLWKRIFIISRWGGKVCHCTKGCQVLWTTD